MLPIVLALVLAAGGPVQRLGQAARLYDEGDYAGARAELLPGFSLRHPAHDYCLYFLGQSAAYAGDPKTALEAFHRLAQMRDSHLAGGAVWREADVLVTLGRLAEAARAYEAALRHSPSAGEPAVARLHLAEAAAAQGRKDAAAALYRKVYVESPAHPLGDEALRRLAEMEGHPPAITPEERLHRADVLSNGRQWPRALEELAKIPADAPRPVRDEADLLIGMTKYRTRHDYPAAADILLKVAERLSGEKAATALFHGARALSRADQDDRAITGYREVVRRFPRSRFAPEAQFLSGWLEFIRGHYDKALPGLADLLAHYSRSEFADDAVWFQGFAHYLMGHLDEAARSFDRLAQMPGAYNQSKARYWKARVLERTGQAAAAVEAYKTLAWDFPLNWYALLALGRLREHKVEVAPFAPNAPPGDAPPIGPAEARLAAEPQVAKADELFAAGLAVEAGEELHRAEPVLVRKLGASRALGLLFDRYRRASNWNRVYLLGEVHGARALHAPPAGETRKWWEAIYPLAYRELVEKFGPRGGNPDYYLYAIMRKESAFNPHDVSYADAIGLLQMIPPTSRRVGEKIGHPYTDDVLYDPAGNVEFGSWYIGQLLRKFKGQVPIGAGSFNAGPRAMIRWLEQSGRHPMDEFVELVVYAQSREYIKLVTDNYAHYLYLYGGKVYEVPMTVDVDYLKNDVDY